jgi:hypothetical protein
MRLRAAAGGCAQTSVVFEQRREGWGSRLGKEIKAFSRTKQSVAEAPAETSKSQVVATIRVF